MSEHSDKGAPIPAAAATTGKAGRPRARKVLPGLPGAEPVAVAPAAPLLTDEPAPAPVIAPVAYEMAAAVVAATPVDSLAESPAPVSIPSAEAPAVEKETIMEEQINTATDRTQAMFADANQRAQGAMEKGARFFEEMGDFGKGNMEALLESGRIAARGFETLGQDAAAYAKRSFEGSVGALKTMSSVKSPTELMKLQGDFFRQSFDALVAHASHSTEATLKLAGEVAQPIQNRLALAAEKVKVAA